MADSNGTRRAHAPLPKGRPVALPKVPDSPRYSMEDLVEATGIPARTIRYYITEGMLTPAYGRGPSATYDKDHMLRLRMIEELKREHLQLKEIKARLQRLSVEDLEAHFSIKSGPNEDRWRRIGVHPDVELHVRERAERDYALEASVQQIVQYARFVLDQAEEAT